MTLVRGFADAAGSSVPDPQGSSSVGSAAIARGKDAPYGERRRRRL
ncbi:MAG: hypothetical protein QNJ49_15615 [Mastigocoleus sp. MO_167.B18]|nr:hypothetical protein [Mastigocoleus sp. MO_188.B34]MDJ0694331.1 hypothetical protein [Mastigocoleus sp. MO_188.B34]MDJ0774829.1 hypothetical protein [Mastigocoleus sp. MO_167.B18]